MCVEGPIGTKGRGSTGGGTGDASGICCCGPAEEIGCTVGIGSWLNCCGGLAAWDTSVCAVCCAACDDSCCRGSASTRTTGFGGVGNIAAAGWTGETSGGLGGIADGLRVSGSREESEGAREGGDGFGTAMGLAKSRFVVSATAMATGGGVIGPVCVVVI